MSDQLRQSPTTPTPVLLRPMGVSRTPGSPPVVSPKGAPPPMFRSLSRSATFELPSSTGSSSSSSVPNSSPLRTSHSGRTMPSSPPEPSSSSSQPPDESSLSDSQRRATTTSGATRVLLKPAGFAPRHRDRSATADLTASNPSSPTRSSSPGETAAVARGAFTGLIAASVSGAIAGGGASSTAQSNATARTHVLQELVRTEQDYVTDLVLITEAFYVPMQQQQVLPADDLRTLFSPVFDSIKGVNVNFLKQLQLCVPNLEADLKDACVADAFLKLADFFKIYSGYFTNQPYALGLLGRAEAESPQFARFLSERLQDPKMRGLTFFAFLIKPVQRLLKYPLLLRELVKYTPDEHPDREKLLLALKKFEDIASQLNEAKRVAEHAQKMFDLQSNMRPDGDVQLPKLWDTKRQLILEGKLDLLIKGKPHKRRVLLFDDLLLVAKQDERSPILKLQANLALDTVKVVNIADSETGTLRHQFGIEKTGESDAYIFVCDDEKQKQEWVHKLKAIIKEYQKAALAARKAVGGL